MKWITLLVVWCFSSLASSYEFVRPGLLNFDESILGRGFSLEEGSLDLSFSERLKSNCLSGNIQYLGLGKSTVKMLSTVGFESKNEFSTIGGKSKVDFWIASAKASVQYLMQEATTSSKESNTLVYEIRGPKYRFENIENDQSKLDYGASLCGDGYLHHVEKGATQLLTASLEFFSKDKKEAFKAKLKIKLAGGLIKKTFRYKDEHKEFFQDAVMTISHYYEGGMTDELMAIRDFQPTPSIKYRCTIANLDICIDKFEEFHQYLTNSNYIARLANDDLYESRYYGVSTYEEAAISGVTRQIASPLTSQYNRLIELSHDLQDQYGEKSRYEDELLMYTPGTNEYENLQNLIQQKELEIHQINQVISDCYSDVTKCV